ncbi:rhodanese-like domain-containing protein [Caulobacter sp.]|uniref:rhodanese-like domain-containing protein n=1 Tax=Caulobacter sp. TaxID=78 RepID=UPI001B060360|nr:rhodanese-like domain-containing protein [Caulobacter sp.]MBO9546310.1 rhodanese-related sulfurtransferase [Caulobacter sp.]
MSLPVITSEDVRRDLIARREIALLDLREEDPFAKAHPLFASQLPLSRLEVEILDRVPRQDVKIVLYDDGEGLVAPAGERLAGLGYTNVHALDGGLAGWKAAGYELFQDVNSYSKAFGELVEARRHTPSLPAQEVQARIDAKADQVILDSRRFEEYAVMSIPGGISTPGAELVLRARELAPDPTTTIIVNCAGRTRSLIGAQSLVNAGLPNPVFALRNGTIGWTLAQQSLEHGQSRKFPDVREQTLEEARNRARDVAYRAGVRRLDAQGLTDLAQDTHRTLYRFDVRTPEEFAAGHLPGFRSAPGGQLVQETDVFAPVRGGRIVLADDLGPRADMTASWLAQLGWEVYVLDGFDGAVESGAWAPRLPVLPTVETLSPRDLVQALADEAVVVVDLAPSSRHRKGHVPGAWFAIRAQLPEALAALPKDKAIVLTSPDGALAALAASELEELTDRPVRVLAGGTDAWIAAGRAVEPGLTHAANAPTDVYKRPYEGTDNAAEAMQAYLDWEFGLVDQLARDATHGFYVI